MNPHFDLAKTYILAIVSPTFQLLALHNNKAYMHTGLLCIGVH